MQKSCLIISAHLNLFIQDTAHSLTHTRPPPHSDYINKYIWSPRRWEDVCLWSWDNEGCTVRALSGGGGIIYITVTSTATEDTAPLCWALCTNTAKSHLGRIHLTRHRYPQQGCWANHRQLLSQPAQGNRHFPSTTFQTYFRHPLSEEMNHALDSFGCLGSIPTEPLRAPGDCCWSQHRHCGCQFDEMSPIRPDRETWGFRKSRQTHGRQNRITSELCFWMWNSQVLCCWNSSWGI